MKKALLAIATAAALSAGQLDTCEKIANLAKIVMTKRQEGVPASTMFKIVKDSGPLFQQMVIEAYKKGQYSTPQFRESIIARFRDRWYIQCVESPEWKKKKGGTKE
jgi:hypothetical protein